MFGIRNRKTGKTELCLVFVILLISAAFLLACFLCAEDNPLPIHVDNDGAGETEDADIEFDIRTESPVLQYVLIAIMILTFGAVIFAVYRSKARKKNLSRQQKRALQQKQEGKQRKNNTKKSVNNTGQSTNSKKKNKSKNKRKK